MCAASSSREVEGARVGGAGDSSAFEDAHGGRRLELASPGFNDIIRVAFLPDQAMEAVLDRYSSCFLTGGETALNRLCSQKLPNCVYKTVGYALSHEVMNFTVPTPEKDVLLALSGERFLLSSSVG